MSPDACRHGHPWTAENTRLDRRGRKVCRACGAGFNRRSRQRARGETVIETPEERVLAAFPEAGWTRVRYRRVELSLWPGGAPVAVAPTAREAWALAAQAVAAGMAEARAKGLA